MSNGLGGCFHVSLHWGPPTKHSESGVMGLGQVNFLFKSVYKLKVVIGLSKADQAIRLCTTGVYLQGTQRRTGRGRIAVSVLDFGWSYQCSY